ncbi:Predicted membrane protein (DUF2078) (plasmid) [Mycolicibacterium gilvum Spyr1]|uniref:Predicted membrane protein (DUF2078) n=2 Tax=Mycolicibacterium TaxID=1866885 RepID=E6TQ71_MYCSR|nr:Predicted membrane protein (DUF2078) [Mycolicibacterium gilvum Spyr1]
MMLATEVTTVMSGTSMGGWWLAWPLLVLIGISLIVYLGYRLVADRSVGPIPPQQNSARRILDERYAKGEIDEDEYLRRRNQLT